jgi:hypothetical protein
VHLHLEARLPLIELRLGQLLAQVDLLGVQVIDLGLQFGDVFVWS